MTTPTRTRAISVADVVAMWMFIAAGIAIVGVTVYGAAVRIAEGLGGGAVEVPALFAGTIVEAPIGPGGAMRDIELQTAILTTDGLSAAGIGALLIEQVIAVASVSIVVGCLVTVTISVMRGRVFGRRNTAFVGTAGLAALLGLAGVPFFGNMVANDAFRAISDGTYDNIVMAVRLSDLVLTAFVVALATTVFTIGARLQRESDLLA